MNPVEKLNGKKGLLAIALLMAVVMALPFAAQYYTWKVSYTINPMVLTTLSDALGGHGGATKISTHVNTTTDAIYVENKADVYFFVPGKYGNGGTNDLGADWYSLSVKIWLDLNDNGNEESGETITLALVSGGTAFTPTYESNIGQFGCWGKITADPSALGFPIDKRLNLRVTIDGWTGALSSSASRTYTDFIWLYAVEIT